MNAIVVGFEDKSQEDAIKKAINHNYFSCKLWISNKIDYKSKIKHVELFNPDNFIIKKRYNYYKDYQLIFNKYFHQYIHSLSREKYIDFTYFEFINLFNLHFNYFYNFIKDNNIELLISSNFLHEGDFLLYPIAKEIFKIEIIIFSQSQFPNKMWYHKSIEDFGSFESIKKLKLNNNVPKELIDSLEIDLFYMKKSFSSKLKENCLYKFIFKDLEKLFNKNRNIKLYQLYLQYTKCKQYNTNLKKYSIKEIDLNIKYVYFPLHLQPELTTSIHGDEYSDQLLALEKLSTILPKDYKIYVKENPKQSYYQRDELFFKRLYSIDKAILIDKTVNTHTLINHSQFVSTISGTVGWEALISQKKVLLFGRAFYQNLSGVFTYNNDFDINALFQKKIDKNILKQEFIELISNTFDGIVDMNYKVLVKNYNQEKNRDNIFKAISIILNKEAK